MPNFLTRQGRDRWAAPTPTVALKPMFPGARILITTSDLTDLEVLVASGRPVQGYISLRQFNNLPSAVVVTPPVSTLRSRDPNTITWVTQSNPISLTDAVLAAGTYGPVLADGTAIITGQSRYSTVPGKSIFSIPSGVTRKVIFRGWNFRGSGATAGASGISMVTLLGNNDVEFEECIWFGEKPASGFASAYPARCVSGSNVINLSFRNCEQYGASGVYIDSWAGDGSAGGRFRLSQFNFKNVDGRMVDASGNWRTGTTTNTDYTYVQAWQMNNCPQMGGFLAEYFRVYQDPVYGARMEDAWSMHSSGGKTFSPAFVTDYLVENMLPNDPAYTGTQEVFGLGRPYTGGGGTSDAGGVGGAAPTANNIASNVQAKRFSVLNSNNYGASITSGQNNTLEDFDVISVGFFRSGAPSGRSRMAATGGGTVGGNVGVQLYCGVQAVADAGLFNGHLVKNGRLMYLRGNTDQALGTSNTTYFYPNTAYTATGITYMPNPASVEAALQLVDDTRASRLATFTAAGKTLGLTDALPVKGVRNHVVYGDDLSIGTTGVNWMSLLQGLLNDGSTVTSLSIAGQTSAEVGARMGMVRNRATFTFTGNSLPASGSVNLTLSSGPDLLRDSTSTQTLTGTFGGVAGTLTRTAGGAYSFARTASGAAVDATGGLGFLPTLGTVLNGGTAVHIAVGRNNGTWSGTVDVASLKADIAAMVALLPGGTEYYVHDVMTGNGEGVGTAAYTAITQLNTDLTALYGTAHRITQRGLLSVGTTDDTPPSAIRTDSLHGTARYHHEWARLVYEATLRAS